MILQVRGCTKIQLKLKKCNEDITHNNDFFETSFKQIRTGTPDQKSAGKKTRNYHEKTLMLNPFQTKTKVKL